MAVRRTKPPFRREATGARLRSMNSNGQGCAADDEWHS